VYFVDKERTITFWNKGAEIITGFRAEEVIGTYCYNDLLRHVNENGCRLCMDGCPLHATIEDGLPRKASVYLHHKNGHRVPVEVKVRPVLQNGEIIGAAEVFSTTKGLDVADLSVGELEYLALFDQLTELPNRRYIDTYLGHRLRDFEELGLSFSLLMMDIDFFKRVNDCHGHEAGDLTLKMVAGTLRGALRSNDFVGRWGGEEFVAILRGVPQAELCRVAEKMRMLISESEMMRDGCHLGVTISIGATTVQACDTASSIVRRADRALYLSKDGGRNRVTAL
jgi:diguanylate cyclase (GGDEF)-like protein/PAS domain S-box-containing protein